MDYITVKEAAVKWNLAERSIQNYCANEKIPGAKCVGGQWFIPMDAMPPADGRTRAGKEQKFEEVYKFPVFVYSRFYSKPSFLTHDEESLLKAQVLRLEGDYPQSIGLCKTLLENDLPSYLAAGAYLTIGVCSALLGLFSEYKIALSKLEVMADKAIKYKEDYRLLAAALQYYVSWDSSSISRLRPSGLSSEAIWYYKIMLLTISILSPNTVQTSYLKSAEADCLIAEKHGLTPVLYLIYGILGIAKDSGRTREEKDVCLKKAIELAIRHHWVDNLARFYSFAPESIDRMIQSYGKSYYDIIHKAYQLSVSNCNIVKMLVTGIDHMGLFSSNQLELLLLVSYGFTNQNIAMCTNTSEQTIKKKLEKLMEISKTASKTELKAYARSFFDSSFQAEKH